jgi:pimeloyl-ACP methyl ester carboxylesterase
MGHSMGGLAVMAFSKLYHDMQNIVDNLIIVDISNRIGAVGSSNKTLLN